MKTSSSEETTSLAMSAAHHGADTVVAAGGDGTVNAVANGLVRTGCRLGIIPLGTANDLATNCGIPIDPVKAADVILTANARPIDMILVNGWYFLTCGGLGFPCEVIGLVERLRRRNCSIRALCRKGGGAIYALATAYRLLNSATSPVQISVESENFNHSLSIHMIIIANQPRLGKHFCVAPGADNCDGLADICLFADTKSKTELARNIFKTIAGAHLNYPGVELFRTSRITLQTEKNTTLFGDGEVHLRARSFCIEVTPRAINVICP